MVELTSNFKPNILTVNDAGRKEVIRIDPEGCLFWKGREVETDDDFRAAMLDLLKAMTANPWRHG